MTTLIFDFCRFLTSIVDIINILGGNMEKVVDATIARRQLGTLLDEVYYKGESIIIERKGKRLAKIVPLNFAEESNSKLLTPMQKKMLAELNSLPIVEIEENPIDLLRKMRKKRAAKAKAQYGI